jgi:dTMP kinase
LSSKGVLVAFEGIDGSGLTTHSRLLVYKLREAGYRVGYSKEPTWSPIGALIRELLLQPTVDHEILALLYAADRLWHLRVHSCLGVGLLKALEEGYIVVLDRYKYSSMAYQSLGAPVEWIEAINSRALEADIIVYLDVPPEVALNRVKARRITYYYETLERLRKVKEAFETILGRAEARGVRVVRIKGVENGVERSIEEVGREVYGEVKKHIEGRVEGEGAILKSVR